MSNRLRDKSLYIIVIGSMIVTIMGLCYFYFFKVLEVDLSENTTIQYNGESGYASISVSNNLSTYDQRHHSFLDSVSYEVSPNEGLSNGDVVTIKAKYNKDLANVYNYHVVGEEQTIQVSGLPIRYNSVEVMDDTLIEELSEASEIHIKENQRNIIDDLLENTKLKKTEILSSELAFQVFMKSNAKLRGDSIFQLYKIEIEGLDTDNKKQTYYQYLNPLSLFYTIEKLNLLLV